MQDRSVLDFRRVVLAVGLMLVAFGLWLTLAPFEVTYRDVRRGGLDSFRLGKLEPPEYMSVEHKCGPPISEWWNRDGRDAHCGDPAVKRAIPGSVAGLIGAFLVFLPSTFSRIAAMPRRRAFLLIGGVALLLLAVSALAYGATAFAEWREAAAKQRAASLVGLDHVDVVELTVVDQADQFGWRPPTLAGRIRNRSPHTLVAVALEFTASDDDDEVIDRSTVTIHKVVPPGETRRFPPVDRGELAVPLEEATLQGAGGPFTWSYVPPVARAKSWEEFLPPTPNSGAGEAEERLPPTPDPGDHDLIPFEFGPSVEVRLVGTRGR